MMENIKQTDRCIMGVSKGKLREKQAESLFKNSNGLKLSKAGERIGHPDPRNLQKTK